MSGIIETINTIFGIGVSPENVTAWQIMLRAAITYIFTLVFVRIGEKRVIGTHTAFDFILGIMLGSLVSQAITGAAPLFRSLAGAFTLVVLHYLAAVIIFRSEKLGDLITGRVHRLVKNGEIQWDAMQNSHITKVDLRAAMRRHASHEDLDNIQDAYLERNGDISVILRPSARS